MQTTSWIRLFFGGGQVHKTAGLVAQHFYGTTIYLTRPKSKWVVEQALREYLHVAQSSNVFRYSTELKDQIHSPTYFSNRNYTMRYFIQLKNTRPPGLSHHEFTGPALRLCRPSSGLWSSVDIEPCNVRSYPNKWLWLQIDRDNNMHWSIGGAYHQPQLQQLQLDKPQDFRGLGTLA